MFTYNNNKKQTMRFLVVLRFVVFFVFVFVYGLRAKKMRNNIRKQSRCRSKRKLHCRCSKRKDVFGHREMHPFCKIRTAKATRICNGKSMFSKYSNFKECIRKNGVTCPKNDPFCEKITQGIKEKKIKKPKNNVLLSVSPLVSCSLNDEIRKTKPNHLIPDEKKAFYCDFEANEKFSKLDYGDGGTFDNAGLVKFLNKDASLVSKLGARLDECICADFSGTNINDCNDIFLCDVTCDAIIEKNSFEAMCKTDWYLKFCSMKCGKQHIRPRKQISKLDGFDPKAYQFSVETKTNKHSISIYSLGHIVKRNIHDASLLDLQTFMRTLAKNIDFKTNGLRSHVHEDWLNLNKMQCHTLSDKAIDTLLGIKSLDKLKELILKDEGIACTFKKGWSNAILDGDKRLFQRCETDIAQNSVRDPFVAKKFVRRLFLDDFENGFVTGMRFIKEYAKLKGANDIVKFIVSLTEEDLRHCNSIDRFQQITKFLNTKLPVPFCKNVIGFIDDKFFIHEDECVNILIPEHWKNNDFKHTPVHKKTNKNKEVKVIGSAKFCRSSDGHFDSKPLDYHLGGVCLTKRHARRLKTMNNGHYVSHGGFHYPLPVETSCNGFNNSRYDRVRLVFEAPEDVVNVNDLGVDEADGRHVPFFDNSLTTLTKSKTGKIIIELFSECKDKKKHQRHSGILDFGKSYKRQPYLINMQGDSSIVEPPFTLFTLDENLKLSTKAWVADELKATSKVHDMHLSDLKDFQKILYTVHSENPDDNLHIISAAVCSHEDINVLYAKTKNSVDRSVIDCIVLGEKCKDIYDRCPINPSMHVDVRLDKNNVLWLIPKHELIHKKQGPMRVSGSCNVRTINYFLELLKYHETISQFSYAITKTACVKRNVDLRASDFFVLQRQLLQNQQSPHKANHNSCKHKTLCIGDDGRTTRETSDKSTCDFNVDLGFEERQKTSWDAILMDPILYLRSYKKEIIPLKFDVIVYNVKNCVKQQETLQNRRGLLSTSMSSQVSFGGGVSSIFNILAALNNTTPQMISFADSLINNNNDIWHLAENTPAAREELYEKIAQMYTEDMLCLHKAYFLYIGGAFAAYYFILLLLSAIFTCFPDNVTGKSISIYYQPNAL